MSMRLTLMTMLLASCFACSNGGPAAPGANGEVSGTRGPTVATGPSFDGVAFCGATPLSVSAIPRAAISGALSRHGGDALTLPFKLLSGRAEIRKDRATLGFASEEMKSCTATRKDGKRSKQPRVNLVLSELKVGTYHFPDTDGGIFKYWNYLYITNKGTPYTMNSLPGEDAAIVVIESIDERQKVVRGKLAACKKRGAGGWVAGTFEVPICE